MAIVSHLTANSVKQVTIINKMMINATRRLIIMVSATSRMENWFVINATTGII